MEIPAYCSNSRLRLNYLPETLRIMRITAFFLFATFLHVSASAFSQKVSLSEVDQPIEKVLKDIEKKTSFTFTYRTGLFVGTKKISLVARDASIENILDDCFKDKPFEYHIIATAIVIQSKESAPNKSISTISPPINVQGFITNEEGDPISSATIAVKGTNIVISANVKGEFIFKQIDPNATLTISCVGYQTLITQLNSRSNLIVSLKKKIGQLDETLVIAYGTTTQRYSVGTVSKVSSEEIETQPITNPLAALEGRIAGLNVTQSSGLPGSSFSVQIRGQNSLSPTNSRHPLFDNPLYIIDGVPFSPQNSNINQLTSLAGNGGTPGDVTNIGTQGLAL